MGVAGITVGKGMKVGWDGWCRTVLLFCSGIFLDIFFAYGFLKKMLVDGPLIDLLFFVQTHLPVTGISPVVP